MSLFFGVASVSVMLPDFGSHNNNAVVVVYLDSFETYLKALILQVSSSATLASSTCCLLNIEMGKTYELGLKSLIHLFIESL